MRLAQRSRRWQSTKVDNLPVDLAELGSLSSGRIQRRIRKEDLGVDKLRCVIHPRVLDVHHLDHAANVLVHPHQQLFKVSRVDVSVDKLLHVPYIRCGYKRSTVIVDIVRHGTPLSLNDA